MEEKITCFMCGKTTLKSGEYFICPECGHIQGDYSDNQELYPYLLSASNDLVLKDFSKAEEKYRNIISRVPGNTDAQWGVSMAAFGVVYGNNDGLSHGVACEIRNSDSFFQTLPFQKIKTIVFDKKLLLYFFERSSYIETARIMKWNEKEISKVKVVAFFTFCFLYVFAIGVITTAAFMYMVNQ